MYYYHRSSDTKTILHRLSLSFKLALSQIECLLEAEGINNHKSTINLVITNGFDMFASRFGSWQNSVKVNKSLYFLQGDEIDFSEDNFKVSSRRKRAKFTMLASEKIVPDDSSWQMIPSNHFFLLRGSQKYDLVPI